jgi:hypothetical protein
VNVESHGLKPPRFIWIVLLTVAVLSCLLSAPPAPVSHIRVIDVPAQKLASLNRSSPTTSKGILADPKFLVVLHALQQREGFETLAEPVVTTTSGRAVNRMYNYEGFTFYINVTNK